MNADRFQRAREVFLGALDQPDPDRRAWIAAQCGEDAELLHDVLGMLEADQEHHTLLDADTVHLASMAFTRLTGEFPETSIGPYRLLRLLGEGGMGAVYLADRTDIGQPVALKILRDAWISPLRRQRFIQEQKLLGRLNHPNIARIYDAGALPSGLPWFAMEYAEGVTLTEWIRSQKRSLRDDLLTFRQVCEAVRYAHSRAVVHRDLKPSNILVTASGQVKLLDFGIAKQLDDDLPEGRTMNALRMMTPAYAAPEQRSGGLIGIYTDIYTLGLLLYEIVTGVLPSPAGESTPAPPPSRAAAASHAGQRYRPERSQWAELDELCLTALKHKPEDRYLSVDALIRDLDAFLQGRPLQARPRVAFYTLRKFVSRYRVPLLAAAAILIALAGAATWFTVTLAQANRTARAELARSRRIQQFTISLFNNGDPEGGRPVNVSTNELLRRGQADAETMSGDPVLQADMFATLGEAWQHMGQFAPADSLLQRALDERRRTLGDHDVRVVDSLVSLGLLRKDQNRMVDAEDLLRRAVLLNDSRQQMASPGRPLWALGYVLGLRGSYPEARAVLEKAVTLDQRSSDSAVQLADDLTQLADVYFYLSDYVTSAALNHRALELRKSLFGSDHLTIASSLSNLASIDIAQGRFDQAEQEERETLRIITRWYGDQHPAVAEELVRLEQIVSAKGQYAAASDLLDRALNIQMSAFGHDNSKVALVYNARSVLEFDRDQYDAAERDSREALGIWKKVYGDKHQFVGLCYANLASDYMQRHQYAQAEEMARRALAIYQLTLPANHVNIAILHVKLGRILLREGRFAEAEPETRAAYEYFSTQPTGEKSYLNGARKDLAAIEAHLHP